jgi:hypothetical protein
MKFISTKRTAVRSSWLWALAAILPGPSATAPASVPDDSAGQTARLGEFDHSTFGSYRVDVEDQLPTSKYWGVLPHTDTIPGLWLTAKDGTVYITTDWLSFTPGSTVIKAGPWGGGQKSGQDGKVGKNPDYKPWAGNATLELTPDKQLKWTVGNEVLVYGNKTMSWKASDGTIDLSGTLATPVGVQFLFPWRDPAGVSDMMYFSTHLYKVEGFAYGKQVSGFMSVDNNWGNQGYRDNWWVRNRRTGHWLFFATEYENGQVDTGYLICGKYGDTGASFVDDKGKEVFSGDRVGIYPQRDASGKAGNIIYTSDKGSPDWEFDRDPKLAMPVTYGYEFGIGVVKRVGETRKIVNAIGVYQTYGGGSIPTSCSPPRH